MAKYDFLVVGCGIFGAVFAQKKTEEGKKVIIIDKRSHIGGNCYTENINGINIHKYGPHIFHTNSQTVWDYVNRFASFNNFRNRPKVKFKNKIYSFPVNLMTLYQIYGVQTPAEAKRKLEHIAVSYERADNLEDWILSKVGAEIYEIFFKGYTKKQWRKSPRELPASIIKRLPIRFTFNEDYFDDIYQGIPIGGYTRIFEQLISKAEVKLNTDYLLDKHYWDNVSEKIIYTGKIDEYFDYKFGCLEYLGLRFENELLEGDYQGNAVVNYTEESIPFTRIIEHKHFEYKELPHTIITKEFPVEYDKTGIPYYPVNTPRNNALYESYKNEVAKIPNLYIGGRLGYYKYLNMDEAILSALELSQSIG